MKKTVYTAFIAFWTFVVTLAALDLLSPRATAGDESGSARYTLEEVARHDTPGDCWMIIEGNVYDLSAYIPQHPTPPSVVTPWCGKDASEGMRTKGYGRDHSPAAWASLADYLIGQLDGE